MAVEEKGRHLTVSVIVRLDFKLSEQLPQKEPVDNCIQTRGPGHNRVSARFKANNE